MNLKTWEIKVGIFVYMYLNFFGDLTSSLASSLIAANSRQLLNVRSKSYLRRTSGEDRARRFKRYDPDYGVDFQYYGQESEDDDDFPPDEEDESKGDEKSSHAKRNCSPPAYHEFPQDLFTIKQRAEGAIALHITCVCFMFLGLAIICDDYFVPSLEKICERLNLGEDVAGATFMAAGSSAPELFTSIIGVFVAKGDVGTGTIVGSAVFNILFVVGICGLCAGQAVQLSWWPLFRDSTFYALSVALLMACIYDSEVTWWESCIMLSLYVFYILIMKFNSQIYDFVSKRTNKSGDVTDAPAAAASSAAGILPPQNERKYYGNYEVMKEDEEVAPSSIPMKQMGNGAAVEQFATDEIIRRSNRKVSWPDMALRVMMGRQFRGRTRFRMAARVIIAENQLLRYEMSRSTSWRRKRYSSFRQLSRESDANSYTKAVRNNSWQAPLGLPVDQEEVVYHEWLKVPSFKESGILGVLRWIVSFPINVLLYYTVPDCRKKRWERWYMLGFFMAIVWIAVFSYIMVWMVCLIGYTMGIPDSVMGITFLAAGTSIPDAMASLIVARQGQGDMAVSNSIGSNVFDILIGLALPWFLTTAIVHPGSIAYINSNGIIFSVSLLFFTVVFTLVTVHLNHWVLDWKLGTSFMVVYMIFVALSTLIEMNVFGYVNAPMCTD